MTERFHISEWYGRPVLNLTDEERIAFAKHKVGGSAMTKSDLRRLLLLEDKFSRGKLSTAEAERLEVLRKRLDKQNQNEKICPFRTDLAHPTCTKPGGVCSLQLYSDTNGRLDVVNGVRGKIRALCPYRFHQMNKVFQFIGKTILGNESPSQVREIGFLQSTGNLDSSPGEDVGRIDMVLVDRNSGDSNIRWVAVEIQAVYFSGPEMKTEFTNIIDSGGVFSFPLKIRRPDYRSSGPKRLMPQLQIKVPTLRRWGKKMVIVVDQPFFLSMGEMRKVSDITDSDIVWCVVDFINTVGSKINQIEIIDTFYTTLESAIEGLTGGTPVSLGEFEERICLKNQA